VLTRPRDVTKKVKLKPLTQESNSRDFSHFRTRDVYKDGTIEKELDALNDMSVNGADMEAYTEQITSEVLFHFGGGKKHGKPN
jgi:hypothetical protein